MDKYARVELALRILALGGAGELQTLAQEVLKVYLAEPEKN